MVQASLIQNFDAGTIGNGKSGIGYQGGGIIGSSVSSKPDRLNQRQSRYEPEIASVAKHLARTG